MLGVWRQRSIRRPARCASVGLLVGLVVGLVIGVVTVAHSQSVVPSEKEIPAIGRVVNANLPSEHELPGAEAIADLPSEREVPWLVESEQGETSKELSAEIPAGRLDRDEVTADERPWLSLAVPGHVGVIRDMEFAANGRLCTAGDDKFVEVWRRLESAGKEAWVRTRRIRWQVARGPRGRIYALAVHNQLLALAGHGAQGSLGEILLVDAVSGELSRALWTEESHRNVITDLEFSSDGRWLVSSDVEGCVIAWAKDSTSGQWRLDRRVHDTDRSQFPAEQLQQLAMLRRFHPVGLVRSEAEDYVISPRPKFSSDPSAPTWRLHMSATDWSRPPIVMPAVHRVMVTAIAVDRKRGWIASADAAGNVYLQDIATKTIRFAKQLYPSVAPLRMKFDASGRLLVGTSRDAKSGDGLLDTWDVSEPSAPTRLDRRQMVDDVFALAVADDGVVAVADGSRIQSIGPTQRPPTKRGADRPLTTIASSELLVSSRVQFHAANDDTTKYYLRWKSRGGKWMGFDPQRPRLLLPTDVNGGKWKTCRESLEGWRVNEAGDDLVIEQAGVPRGRISFVASRHGRPTCWCLWKGIASPEIVIGTDGRNQLYHYMLPSNDASKDASDDSLRLVRQFRGHTGAVESLCRSADGRYLASTSRDGTIRIWNMAEGVEPMATATRTNRTLEGWGVTLEATGGRLAVSAIAKDSPLYFRGVRRGFELLSIRWYEEETSRSASQPQAILTALAQPESWDRLVAFRFRRNRSDELEFQSYAAWQPLLSLFVTEQREWACWTAEGYYDASFQGDQLLGWQINRGVQRLPDYFMAAQMRRALERPDILRKMMTKGNLTDAAAEVRRVMPGQPQHVIRDQIRMRPRVQILSPAEGEVAEGKTTTVTAEISLARGQRLVAPKLFANGVIATERRQISRHERDGREFRQYAWQVALPSEQNIQLQLLTASDEGAVAAESREIKRQPVESPIRRRLEVIAVGVGNYVDPRIGRLEFASRSVGEFCRALHAGGTGVYEVQTTEMLDAQVEPATWKYATRDMAQRLEGELGPDDLIVIYVTGHGVRDRDTSEYYYVGQRARLADIRAGSYQDCLSMNDFRAFENVGCRKLLILDTCHSGAVQRDLAPSDLQGLLRPLQSDLFLIFSASEGQEEAVEDRSREMGRFTYYLLQACQGEADKLTRGGNEDGTVSLQEAISYVQDAMSSMESLRDQPQHPVAGPASLLRRVNIPLTRVR